jgi:hypothetical protein
MAAPTAMIHAGKYTMSDKAIDHDEGFQTIPGHNSEEREEHEYRDDDPAENDQCPSDRRQESRISAAGREARSACNRFAPGRPQH